MRPLAAGIGAVPLGKSAATRRRSRSSTRPTRWTEAVQRCTATGRPPDHEVSERAVRSWWLRVLFLRIAAPERPYFITFFPIENQAVVLLDQEPVPGDVAYLTRSVAR
jgi:hypothetical protein